MPCAILILRLGTISRLQTYYISNLFKVETSYQTGFAQAFLKQRCKCWMTKDRSRAFNEARRMSPTAPVDEPANQRNIPYSRTLRPCDIMKIQPKIFVAFVFRCTDRRHWLELLNGGSLSSSSQTYVGPFFIENELKQHITNLRLDELADGISIIRSH